MRPHPRTPQQRDRRFARVRRLTQSVFVGAGGLSAALVGFVAVNAKPVITTPTTSPTTTAVTVPSTSSSTKMTTPSASVPTTAPVTTTTVCTTSPSGTVTCY